jgi:hypothetical protein
MRVEERRIIKMVSEPSNKLLDFALKSVRTNKFLGS